MIKKRAFADASIDVVKTGDIFYWQQDTPSTSITTPRCCSSHTEVMDHMIKKLNG